MNTKKETAIAWALSESLSSAAWDASFRSESQRLSDFGRARPAFGGLDEPKDPEAAEFWDEVEDELSHEERLAIIKIARNIADAITADRRVVALDMLAVVDDGSILDTRANRGSFDPAAPGLPAVATEPLRVRLREMHAGHTEELESTHCPEARRDTLRRFLDQIESAQRVVAFLAGE